MSTLTYWCLVMRRGVTEYCVNSLVPGRFEFNFRQVIFKLILVVDACGISCETVLRSMPLYLTDYKSAWVQVMAWCCQAISHYLSQCWLRSMSPYGVTRPLWVNIGSINACSLLRGVRAKPIPKPMQIYCHTAKPILKFHLLMAWEPICSCPNLSTAQK